MTRLLMGWYRRMLALLPADFHGEYADEMAGLLQDLLRDQPSSRQLRIFTAAVIDLSRTVPTQHLTTLTDPARQRVAAPVGGPAAAINPFQAPVRAGRPLPSRRRFLRVAMAATVAAMGGGVASAGIAYLWPRSGAGFGSLIDVGAVDAVRAEIAAGGGTFPVPAARSYLVAYDPADDPHGDYADITAGSGMMALYQKCVHLGCRVPWCGASSWFECPCHGSQYNRWGEFQDGPAPRGLDRFAVGVIDGRVVVDTRQVVTGPSRGVDTLREPPRGPHCV